MLQNQFGEIVTQVWLAIPGHFPQVIIDACVVMPNHIHGIVVITVGAQHAAPLPKTHGLPPGSLGAIVRSFKSAATKRINDLRSMPGQPVWQRNYYEPVVRDDFDLDRIRQYITDNPGRWEEDNLNPTNMIRSRPS